MAQAATDRASALAAKDRPCCMQLFDQDNDARQRYGIPATNLPPKDGSEGGKFHILALDRKLLWGQNQVLTVKFLGKVSESMQKKVKKYASIWTEYCNLKFDWVGPEKDAIIRVTMNMKDKEGHYSRVGKDNLSRQQNKNTMNIAHNDDDKDEDEVRDTILHEFGHAIGCVHEQESSSFPAVHWKKQLVYDYFKEKYGWGKKDVDDNFNNFEPPGLQNTLAATPNWDGKSIMQYELRPEWTEEGYTGGSAKNLTDYDKWFIGQIYPKTTKKP